LTHPSLLACLCLKAFPPRDDWSCEALLASAHELRAALGLHVVPGHSTPWLVQPPQSQTTHAGVSLTRDRPLVPARGRRTLPHGGRVFHRCYACTGQSLQPAAGRYTPLRPHVAEAVGRGLEWSWAGQLLRAPGPLAPPVGDRTDGRPGDVGHRGRAGREALVPEVVGDGNDRAVTAPMGGGAVGSSIVGSR
jgi:hypothetical protein